MGDSGFNFRVDLSGIITLLSDNLYSSPRVYLRELLQNGVDAIRARELLDGASEFHRQIAIELSNRPGETPVLMVEDSGVGLNHEELHEFLSTIGRSSKQADLEGLRTEFIGRFGIGLLSGFMVSEEITVVTRSAKGDSPPLRWVGHIHGEYEVTELEDDLAPGTRVYLKAKPGAEVYFETDYVEKALRDYGLLLRFDIRFRHGGRERLINVAEHPWNQHAASAQAREEGLLDFGKSVFDEEFHSCFVLESPLANGVAFLLPRATSSVTTARHRVYVKGMLVSEECEEILPPWAFFVKALVTSDDLALTASRESLRDDEALAQTRAALGEAIKKQLREMAQHEPQKLEWLIGHHLLAIKAMALDDADFLRTFIDWISFRTSLGEMSFRRLRDQDKVFVAPNLDAFRQVSQLAAGQNTCVVNGGFVYDNELLEAARAAIPGFHYETIDAHDFFDDFEQLELDERAEILPLLEAANRALEPFGCYCDARKFQPDGLPVAYAINAEAQFLRSSHRAKETANSLFSSVLDSVAVEFEMTASSSLYFNFNNALVRRLCKNQDTARVRPVIEVLYVQALLLGQHAMTEQELGLLNHSLGTLIENAL